MDERRLGVGRSHAKIILLGEHAVVYGAPAIAAPVPELAVHVTATRSAERAPGRVVFTAVDREPAGQPAAAAEDADALREPAGHGLQVLVSNTLSVFGIGDCGIDLMIDCGIPTARGLGSSAACGRAVVRALADLFDRDVDERTGFDLVQSVERLAHGTPSGVDAVATAVATPILFRSGYSVPLSWGFDGVFVIADSGLASSTNGSVAGLRARFDRDPEQRTYFIAQATRLAMGALLDIEAGSLAELGAKLTENHELLRDFGLSTDHLDRLVRVAIGAGARGAKVTGGGAGGCAIALADDAATAARVSAELRAAGATATWTLCAQRHLDPAETRRSRI